MYVVIFGVMSEGLTWPVTAELCDFSSPCLVLFEWRDGDELELVRDDGVIVLVALLSGKLTTENDRVTFFRGFLLGALE